MEQTKQLQPTLKTPFWRGLIVLAGLVIGWSMLSRVTGDFRTGPISFGLFAFIMLIIYGLHRLIGLGAVLKTVACVLIAAAALTRWGELLLIGIFAAFVVYLFVPGLGTQTAGMTEDKKQPADRLQTLEDLRQRGLISETEYQVKREQVLSEV